MIALDEMRIKESLTYSVERNEVEGYEEFGSLGRIKYIANHVIAFLVRGRSKQLVISSAVSQ